MRGDSFRFAFASLCFRVTTNPRPDWNDVVVTSRTCLALPGSFSNFWSWTVITLHRRANSRPDTCQTLRPGYAWHDRNKMFVKTPQFWLIREERFEETAFACLALATQTNTAAKTTDYHGGNSDAETTFRVWAASRRLNVPRGFFRESHFLICEFHRSEDFGKVNLLDQGTSGTSYFGLNLGRNIETATFVWQGKRAHAKTAADGVWNQMGSSPGRVS